MSISNNVVIAIFAIMIAACGYYYYQSRQNVVEIKLPSISIEKK